MKNINRKHVLVIVGSILLMIVFLVFNKQESTDYVDVIDNLLNKPVEGIAVSLEDVASLKGMKFILMDTDTDFVNGKLGERENRDDLIGYAIDLFKEVDHLQEISMDEKFKDSGYWKIGLNVDFIEGTNHDEAHKVMLLIDKESHNIMVAKEYDIEKVQNISVTNYRCFAPNVPIEVLIDGIEGMVSDYFIPATNATYTLDQNYGVSMVSLEYASEERLIFRSYFGLFVYDLLAEEIIRSIDLNQINCAAIQGSHAAEIQVNQDGTMVQIHRMDSDKAYLYDVEQNIYTSSIYKPIENRFRMQDSYDEGLMEDALVSAYCVKFGEDDYGYLTTIDYTVGTLEYIRGDLRYLLFKDEISRGI